MENLTIAALMLAHSWYPQECCHDKDCHPIPCAELTVTSNGDAMWKGVLYFSPSMLRDSLDGQCHVCVEEGLNASIIPYPRYAFSSRTRRAERHDSLA
jgi:hypothetical protein